MHDAVRRTKQRQTAKENHFSAMQPHQGRTPIHGGGVGVTGSCIKEAHHHYKQHQLPRPPGAPMAPRPDMPAEAEASSVSAGDGSSAWVKPGCMMELARLAKIPQPESGLTCPRCQSTETKFCYYNNYSLSQPRHFCRACRRYWTHGGALRDLPFCSGVRRRRNKPSNKHNTTSSKAPVACCGGASGAGRASPSSSSSSAGAAAVPASGGVAPAATAILQQPEQLPLLAPLDQLGGTTEDHRTGSSRLWFPGHSSQDPLGYHRQLGNGRIGAANSIRLEHQCYLPQRQQCSLLLAYKNAITASSSAIGPFSAEGGADAVSFAGQMQAITISRLPAGSAALATEPAAASEYAPVEKENPTIIPSTAEMMGTLTTSSPREFLVGLQGDHDLLHFLGSGSSWASCGYGCTTAGNNGSSSCTVAPGSVWAYYPSSGFTSSCSASGTTL